MKTNQDIPTVLCRNNHRIGILLKEVICSLRSAQVRTGLSLPISRARLVIFNVSLNAWAMRWPRSPRKLCV